MPEITGILIRGQGQVAIRRSNSSGASFDTVMVARADGSPCDSAKANTMFSGIADNSVIIVDGDESTCKGKVLVNRIVG